MKQEIEIWRDIQGFEGLYQISSMGRIKSLGNGKSGKSKERIMKLQKDKDEYCIIGLTKEGKRKTYKVHRLVATAFIPNPQNLLEINHKDEDKRNNCISNLDWCTHLYNMNYGTRTERTSKALKDRVLSQECKNKISKANSISILQFSKEGEFMRKWYSTKQASIELGIDNSSITKCCKGKLKTCGGYIWKYADE